MVDFVNGQRVSDERGKQYFFVGYLPDQVGEECVVFDEFLHETKVVEIGSINPCPIEFKHWDVLNKGIRYIAKDGNGEWYGYTEMPQMSYTWNDGAIDWECEEDSGYATHLGGFDKKAFPNVDPGNSLIKRPEGV